MSTRKNRVRSTLITTAAILGLIGCGTVGGPPGQGFVGAKMTGGGWIPSSSGVQGHKANFGFNAAQCVESVLAISGHFNFHDKHAPGFQPGGVKMNGSVVGVNLCSPGPCPSSGCPVGSVEVEVAYRSTNPRFPGLGTALACVEDNGEGAKATAPDRGKIVVMDGPFEDYQNEGPVQGNIQAHTCTCTDGIDNDGDGLTDADDPACDDPNGDEE